MIKTYEVTKLFVGGILDGLTFTSNVKWSEGFQPKEGTEVLKPVGGSPYRIVSVKEVSNG